MIDDPLHHRMLRFDGTDDEVATEPIGARTAGDVVDVEVGDRGGDLLALPVDDGVMDQGAVDGGHGRGLSQCDAERDRAGSRPKGDDLGEEAECWGGWMHG